MLFVLESCPDLRGLAVCVFNANGTLDKYSDCCGVHISGYIRGTRGSYCTAWIPHMMFQIRHNFHYFLK